MAPLPVTNTARLFIDYAGTSGSHTAMIRLVNSATAAGATAVGNELSALFGPLWTNEATVTGFRFSAAGDVNSFPITFTGTQGSGGANVIDFTDAKFISFIGRSTGGRRARIFLYNSAVGMVDDYRLESPEYTPAMDSITAYLDQQPSIVGIDGNRIVWQRYINQGISAYWQKAYRRTR